MTKLREPISYFDGTTYDFLSNFHPSPIYWCSTARYLNGEVHRADTVEHVYQAEKATNPGDYERVLHAQTPGIAKRIGRHIKLRTDWERHKFKVMKQALRLKFAPGTPLAEKLLETGDRPLIEGNHWHDNIWGDCVCGRGRCRRPGKNHLGRMLMEVRYELLLEEDRCQ